jgi:hypothetical protein
MNLLLLLDFARSGLLWACGVGFSLFLDVLVWGGVYFSLFFFFCFFQFFAFLRVRASFFTRGKPEVFWVCFYVSPSCSLLLFGVFESLGQICLLFGKEEYLGKRRDLLHRMDHGFRIASAEFVLSLALFLFGILYPSRRRLTDSMSGWEDERNSFACCLVDRGFGRAWVDFV